MKRLLIIFFWIPVTFFTLFIAFFLQFYRVKEKEKLLAQSAVPKKTASSSPLYFSLPPVLGISTFETSQENFILELTKKYLEKYKSPMLEVAEDLVDISQKYDLDPLLLLAIAQCESNLGKKMPQDCYNPFGWGIHSKGTLCFSSWQEGFEKVCQGLKEKYFSQGLHSPEELMVKYTPLALEKNGSWAKCVNHFLEDLDALNEIKPYNVGT